MHRAILQYIFNNGMEDLRIRHVGPIDDSWGAASIMSACQQHKPASNTHLASHSGRSSHRLYVFPKIWVRLVAIKR